MIKSSQLRRSHFHAPYKEKSIRVVSGNMFQKTYVVGKLVFKNI